MEARKREQLKYINNSKLVCAIRKGDISGVSAALTDGGADTNLVRFKHSHDESVVEPPLTVACRYQSWWNVDSSHQLQIEIVKLLLKHGAEVDEVMDDRETTALGFASSHGCLDIMKLLLDHGADVNFIRMHDGFPVLMIAARALDNSYEAGRLLIERDADINYKNLSNESALNVAVYCNNFKLVELLLEKGAETSNTVRPPLVNACAAGHTDCARLILKHGVDVNVRSIRQNTALMCASREGHTECIQLLLLDHRADINVRSSKNALMLASENGHVDAAQLLLENGAIIDEVSSDDLKRTAIELACFSNREKVVELLIKRGANVEPESVLLKAIDQNWNEVVRILLEKGAPSNVCDKYGYSALMKAVEKKKLSDC